MTVNETVVPSFKSVRALREYCAKSPIPVLLDFTATWCAPCRAMKAPLDKLSKHFGDKLQILQIDIDKAPRIARAFDVMAVPSLILMSRKKALLRLEGAHSFTEMKKALEKHLAPPDADGTDDEDDTRA